MLTLFIAAIAAIAAIAILLILGTFLLPKLASRRHRNRLRLMQVADLALEALRSADAAGIRKRFPEAAIFRDQPWTDESLAKALDDLYASMAAEDRRTTERGPGSWVYYWYDFGLASIREAIHSRRAG